VSCPYAMVPAEVFELLKLASHWKAGMPPTSGGFMEQTESIIVACEFVWNERERAKRQLGLVEMDGQLVQVGG